MNKQGIINPGSTFGDANEAGFKDGFGFPYSNRLQKKGYPYSNLSAASRFHWNAQTCQKLFLTSQLW